MGAWGCGAGGCWAGGWGAATLCKAGAYILLGYTALGAGAQF